MVDRTVKFKNFIEEQIARLLEKKHTQKSKPNTKTKTKQNNNNKKPTTANNNNNKTGGGIGASLKGSGLHGARPEMTEPEMTGPLLNSPLTLSVNVLFSRAPGAWHVHVPASCQLTSRIV